MRSEVRLTLAGEERLLACPLGAIEEIARVEPKLRQALDDLANGTWSFRLVRVVLSATLRAGHAADGRSGDPLTADQVIEADGLATAALAARLALGTAFFREGDVEPGKPEAAASE